MNPSAPQSFVNARRNQNRKRMGLCHISAVLEVLLARYGIDDSPDVEHPEALVGQQEILSTPTYAAPECAAAFTPQPIPSAIDSKGQQETFAWFQSPEITV